MLKERNALKKELEVIDRKLKSVTGMSGRRKLIQRRIEIQKDLKKKGR